MPEVGQPRVGPFDRPAHPERNALAAPSPGGVVRPSLGADEVVDPPVVANLVANRQLVVAAVEVQGLDLDEQTAAVEPVECRFQQDAVVAVRSGGLPAQRDAVAVGDE